MDTIRHFETFNPECIKGKRIDVVGAGSTGSKVVLELVKLGLEGIHVWDDDIVESHNIVNQYYGISDIGKLKVDALKERIHFDTGVEIITHPEKVVSQELGNFIFLLTDTMSSRKEIWQNCIKGKFDKELLIETRIGLNNGQIYIINPNKPGHISKWEKTLFDDSVGEVSACGGSISIGATSTTLSGIAVWLFMQHMINIYTDREFVNFQNQIVFNIVPFFVDQTKWTA